jgi:hypothetical protein
LSPTGLLRAIGQNVVTGIQLIAKEAGKCSFHSGKSVQLQASGSLIKGENGFQLFLPPEMTHFQSIENIFLS